MTYKNMFCTMSGILGGYAAAIFGGWSAAMTTLVILMLLDYISGFIVAAVFGTSEKTANGGLSSKVGWKGVCRKCVTLMIVIVAYRLDVTLNTEYIKEAVIIAFAVNECISLIENAGLMGIPIPKIILNAIDVLKEKKE